MKKMYKLRQREKKKEKSVIQQNIENIVTNGLGYGYENRGLAFELPAKRYFIRGLNQRKLIEDIPNTQEELKLHLYNMDLNVQKSLKTSMGVSESGLDTYKKIVSGSRKENLLSMFEDPSNKIMLSKIYKSQLKYTDFKKSNKFVLCVDNLIYN
jgi:hypothetical protein